MSWDAGDIQGTQFANDSNAGNIVDAEVVPFERPKRDDTKAKPGPPRVDDWQDWFSRVIIKTASEYYLDLAFRGIDEDQLSDREVRSLELQPDQRDRIAKPLAELANKLKFTRKHGRAIIASTGTLESLITLGQWVSKVNRIAAKCRKRQQPQETSGNVGTGPSSANTPNGQSATATYSIYNPGSG